jgi:hypothetical protein
LKACNIHSSLNIKHHVPYPHRITSVLYTIIFNVLKSRCHEKSLQQQQKESTEFIHTPAFILITTSFIRTVFRYLNFKTFSNNVLAQVIWWPCHWFWLHIVFTYSELSAVTSELVSLLAHIKSPTEECMC